MNNQDARDERLIETTLGEEMVFSGRIFDVTRRLAVLPDGKTAPREIVVHRGAAAVVAVDGRGRVALVRQYRAAFDRVMLEIPAGKRDTWEEDPLDCAVRELREETGLTAESMRLLTATQTTPGFCTEQIWIYLATGLAQGEEQPDEDEFLTCSWENLSDMADKVRAGEIGDGKTALGLLLAEAALKG